MFGIGSTELLVILVVALIVLGPRSLATVSRSLGKAVGEFRRVSTDFQRTLNVETARDELREAEEKRKRQSAATQAKDGTGSGNPFASAGNEGIDDRQVPGNTEAAEKSESTVVGVPEDSPIAQALQKSRAEAAAFENSGQKMETVQEQTNRERIHG